MKKMFAGLVLLSTALVTAGCTQISDLFGAQINQTSSQSISSSSSEPTASSTEVTPSPSNDSSQQANSSQIDWSLFASGLENQITSAAENGNCQYLDELFNSEKKQLTPDAVEPLKSNVEKLLEMVNQLQSIAGCK